MFFCLLARFLNNHRELMRWVFLVKVPTSFSSIEKLAKENGKWLLIGTHQKKSGGHGRFFKSYDLVKGKLSAALLESALKYTIQSTLFLMVLDLNVSAEVAISVKTERIRGALSKVNTTEVQLGCIKSKNKGLGEGLVL